MTAVSSIFLAGASRGVGREIAQCLISQKSQVKALLRTDATRDELEALGIKVVLGDAMLRMSKVQCWEMKLLML
jgi:NAD(P)-dependent dehydrogenase (short-subunit alcohol dehydrogenase family)